LWTSTNDHERRSLEWDGTIPFDDWILIVYGKIDRDEKWKIWDKLNGPCNQDTSVTSSSIMKYIDHEAENNLSYEMEDDSKGKRHWCEEIKTHGANGEELWASCDPYDNSCNGGSSMARVGDYDHLWTSTYDDRRSDLPWLDRLGFNVSIKIKYGRVDASTTESFWKGCMNEENLSNCTNDNDAKDEIGDDYKTNWGEEKDRCKKELIQDKLDDDWFKETDSDDDDIDRIMDYLELQGHDGFMDPDDEAYEQQRCKLLGIPYKKPPPIVAETYEMTKYHLRPDERFAKVRRIERKEFWRTTTNLTWMRHNLMREMDDGECLFTHFYKTKTGLKRPKLTNYAKFVLFLCM
jgi:hypothetical protein